MAQQQREEVDKLRAKNMEELQKKKQEEEAEQEKQKRVAEKIRKDFLQKQKSHLTNTFQQTYKQRDDLILRQEEQKNLEKENEAKLKVQMEKFIKESKLDREVEKRERQEINQFIN